MMIKSNKNLPQHNQGIVEKFIEEDIPSGEPYFMFFKKNNGEQHILTNIYNIDNIKIIIKSFEITLKEFLKVNNIKENDNST